MPSRVHCLPLRRPVLLPRNPCGACQPAPPAPADSQVASGNSSEKGYICAIATVVSGAFIGAERQFHSGGELPSATNNSVVAALRTIWPGTFPSEKDFPGAVRVDAVIWRSRSRFATLTLEIHEASHTHVCMCLTLFSLKCMHRSAVMCNNFIEYIFTPPLSSTVSARLHVLP